MDIGSLNSLITNLVTRKKNRGYEICWVELFPVS